MDTVWILGDQLNRNISSLAERVPETTRVLMVESDSQIRSRRWHRQRLHLVLTSMRRFAHELEIAGFDVDYRRAPTLGEGLAMHRRAHEPERVIATEPMTWRGRRALDRQGVELVRSNQFLCHHEDFAGWAQGRKRLKLEDFYRWQRRRLGLLMDGDEPAGGRWNYDEENREPPPSDDARDWAPPARSRLDALDREIIAALPDSAFGAPPDGTWATSRRAALARLRHFLAELLPRFGPHQDAMLRGQWSIAHSLLSPYLNLGLLTPHEVCRAAEEAYRSGKAPIASVEGFIRQIAGWREYVWGVYWLWMPRYREGNALAATRPLPPVFTDRAQTRMACLRITLDDIERRGYAHHIQRLMVIGNLCLLAGVQPAALVEWMTGSFVDGADWVMLPNVLGMALYADGGKMATKPYAASGRYIDRMSDYCGACEFDPGQRVGEGACPYTTLYWDFMARNRERLEGNRRLGNQLRMVDRLSDMQAVRRHAAALLERLEAGTL